MFAYCVSQNMIKVYATREEELCGDIKLDILFKCFHAINTKYEYYEDKYVYLHFDHPTKVKQNETIMTILTKKPPNNIIAKLTQWKLYIMSMVDRYFG